MLSLSPGGEKHSAFVKYMKKTWSREEVLKGKETCIYLLINENTHPETLSVDFHAAVVFAWA